MARFSFGGGTDVGRKRQHNEDSYKADLSAGLWLIADGMGGAKGGGVASKTAIEEIVYNSHSGVSLTDSILAAHQTIVDQSISHEELSGMGSTIVALKCGKTKDYEISWVGDSRAYLWDKKLTLLTHDHSYVQGLVDDGKLEAKNAWNHPNSNVITQALGMVNKTINVGNIHGQWLKDQKILLCSDGLHSELRDHEIESLISSHLSNQKLVDNLINSALEKGGKDNISVFIISSPIDGSEQEDTGDATIPLFNDSQITASKPSNHATEKSTSLSKHRIVLLVVITLILLTALLSKFLSSPFSPP
jgi:PPM family protein phosphatase